MCGARVRAGRWRFSRRALCSEALHSSGHTFGEKNFSCQRMLPPSAFTALSLSLTLFSASSALLSLPLPLLACPMRLPRALGAHSHG